MAIRKRKKPDLVLPLSSMGDIAFLLIIFFMLASNFMKSGNVQLEKAASPDVEQQEAPKASVLLDENAVIWYEGVVVTVGEVEDALKRLAGDRHDLAVHVSIHKTLMRKDYMPLITAVSNAGCKLVLTGEKEN